MSQFYDVAAHFWDELVSRPSGPLAFRFILQPVMAAGLAIRDGYNDAQNGRSPYLWTIVNDPARRWRRLHEGVKAVARVLLLGAGMEIIYQYLVLKAFRPVEMIDILVLLAFIPYLIVRGPAQRIARHWLQRDSAVGRSQPFRHG
jgi:hypothetical protein